MALSARHKAGPLPVIPKRLVSPWHQHEREENLKVSDQKKPPIRSVLSAFALAAGIAATPAATEALPIGPVSADEIRAFEEAITEGSMEALQRFLSKYPNSVYAGEVFDGMVKQIQVTAPSQQTGSVSTGGGGGGSGGGGAGGGGGGGGGGQY